MTLRILIADDEKAARFGMAKALGRLSSDIIEAENGREALDVIREQAPDLVFLDLNMPVMDGQTVLAELAGEQRRCEIIVVTANDSIDAAVECIRLGAADYISKPYEIEKLRAIARRCGERLELESRVEGLKGQLDEKTAFGSLIGISRPMRELFGQMQRAAAAPLDILVRGETGTGKELIAREIHRLSDRADGPFVAVNTAAVSESLAESELFGHVKGAFTSAVADRKGVFEQADGGTLFLDEIGDMPMALQTKMLRTLQERIVQPVGAAHNVKVDVRVVSATHQDLTAAIDEGHFRQDLYYRIRGVELNVPPLHARREDILLLANYFLERANGGGKLLAGDAVERLLSHNWPGNVRELEQVVTAAGAMAEGESIAANDLAITGCGAPTDGFAVDSLFGLPLTEAKGKLVEWFERTAIQGALDANDNNVSAAARQLGIHRQSLQQKMSQLGLTRDQ